MYYKFRNDNVTAKNPVIPEHYEECPSCIVAHVDIM